MNTMLKNHFKNSLPLGVKCLPFKTFFDERGSFTEIFRDEWHTGVFPKQWNVVHSRSRTLRGVHVHLKHWDYLIVIKGKMLLGLKDLRRKSSSFNLSVMPTLDSDDMCAWITPPGVAHGFYFPVDSTHIYSVTEYWNLDDELGCLWNEKKLGFNWPVEDPLLSERDKNASDLDSLMNILDKREFNI